MADGTELTYDFFASVPGIGRTTQIAGQTVPVDVLFGSTTQTFHVGAQSCAVPGFTKGVLLLHEQHGSLPLRRVMQPGIDLARNGLYLPPQQAYCHHLLTPILTRTADGRAVFAPAGPMLVAGDHFAQPQLADTLELLAHEGESAFYRGDIAREIERWSNEHDGLISRADLAAYQACVEHPVRRSYREFTFLSARPPSSGGALIAFALALVERAARADRLSVIDLDSPQGASLVTAAMIASNEIRGREFDHWLYGEGELVDWLLDEPQLERGDQLLANARQSPPSPSSRLGSTTQLSVIDRAGNAVSMTTTTGCGSGEFVTDTGIHLNNMLGEEDLMPVEHSVAAGERLTSMMAPSLLLDEADRPVLVTGSAGSSRLRGAILQTMLRVVYSRAIDEAAGSAVRPLQQRVDAAVQAGRLHAEAGIVHVEAGVSPTVVEALRAAGHQLNEWPATNMYFGGANIAAAGIDRQFAAAGDHRRGGGACIAFEDGSIAWA